MLMRRGLLRFVILLLALPAAYLLLALLLGLVPVNAGFVPTPPHAGGVTIFLRTNGVHADLVLPAAGPHDWRSEFPLEEVAADPIAASLSFAWVAFGWGDRDFYIRARTWADLRPGMAFFAVTGLGRSAMHVEYLARPQDYRVQRIDLSRAQYLAVVRALQAGFARDAGGRPLRIDAHGYFESDAFYEGTGRYTFWLTCNEWIRRVLAQAGVRTAAWAPFDTVLFWHLRQIEPGGGGSLSMGSGQQRPPSQAVAGENK